MLSHLSRLSSIEIREAYVLDETVVDELLHFAPRVHVVRRVVAHCTVFVARKERFAAFEAGRPVNEIQIDIVQLESIQRLLKRRANVVRMMTRVPQLRRNENVFSFDRRADFRLERLADFSFVSVDVGAVDVTIADVDCVLDGSFHFARLALPRAETDERYFDSRVEFDGAAS